MVRTSTVEGWPHTEPTLIHSSTHLLPFNPPPLAPSLDPARVHRPLQRGRSVFTFVIYCHHLSVDGDEKGVYYDNMECLFFRAVLSETTLPQRLRGLGDLWGASAWTHGHTITWEDA